jgi:hypothetical protein
LRLVILAALFVLDPLAGSVAVIGVAAAGAVVDAAGDAGGEGLVAVPGAGLVFAASSASTGVAGKQTKTTAAAAATRDSAFI